MSPTEPEVRVTDRRLPGGGHLFEVPLPDGSIASVVLRSGGDDRELHLLEPGEDEPRARLYLPRPFAETIGALLSGMRLVFDDNDDHDSRAGVQVRTMIIGPASPAIGHTVAEIELPAPDDARILAVVRDDTPALIEEDEARICQPGDRLVLAGRPRSIDELRRFLTG